LVTEKALLFGARKSLVGIVTDPEISSREDSRCGVVILNAGIVHRVGPNRLHVKLARKLAGAGFVVMRFDFSGIGDSLRRLDGRPFRESALEEVREALDYLAASRKVERFVLVGICSGADNALRAAARDPRVLGAVLIEGHAVPTTAYLRRLYRRKLLRPRSWLRFLAGKSEIWKDVIGIFKRSAAAGKTVRVREQSLVPSRQEILTHLRALAARGTRMLLVYSEGSPSHFFYEKGVRRRIASIRRQGIVTAHLIRGADHIFTQRASQNDLLATIFDWTGSLRLPSESASSPSSSGFEAALADERARRA
jgi:pimeloyl-ACP methyl ester carboxylesterase